MRKSWLVVISLLIILFIVLILLMPVASSELVFYHTSLRTYHSKFLLLEMPVVLIWIIALYGTTRLQTYADIISGSPEGASFRGLARGCRWLAWGLPLSAIATLGLTIVAKEQANFVAASVIISNYISLLFPIVAFSVMSKSTAELRNQYQIAPTRRRLLNGQQGLFVVIGIFYTFLFLHNVQLDRTGLAANSNPFYLPIWILVLGLIIPYLYAWFLGLLTVFDIVALAGRSPGVIYRRALRTVGLGIVVIICSLMSVQYERSQLPQSHASLTVHMLAAYFVYCLSLIGFVLLLLGVRQLQKIEEV